MDIENKQTKHFSLAKGPGRGILEKKEDFQTIIILLQPKNQEQMINPLMEVSILNVNSPNIPIKRQGWEEWIQNGTQLYAVYKKKTLQI